MFQGVDADFNDMETKLKVYVDKGKISNQPVVHEEPFTTVRPNASLIKPLKHMGSHTGRFIAVDCGTRTLKRANNWGIYLMRASCVTVEGRKVDWTYSERICTVIGDSHVRRSFLQDFRIELESQSALKVLRKAVADSYHVHGDVRSIYLLLDGGGYFGGERKFRVSLYEECQKTGANLLALSKNSPSLHDDKGRDLVATTYMMAPSGIWVYYPVRKADKDHSLYGDIAIVKLCSESSHAFRCDIMDYLTNKDVGELLSPLTSVSEDPRCLGYPVSLFLAHDFSRSSDTMLLAYHDQIEEKLKCSGLLDSLRVEELSCSFADKIHGINHAFEWELWNDQF